MSVTSAYNAVFIKVGDKLSNNDPRAVDPVKKVVTVAEIGVVTSKGILGVAYQSNRRRVTISYDRIFVDRKPRHQGYNWIG